MAWFDGDHWWVESSLLYEAAEHADGFLIKDAGCDVQAARDAPDGGRDFVLIHADCVVWSPIGVKNFAVARRLPSVNSRPMVTESKLAIIPAPGEARRPLTLADLQLKVQMEPKDEADEDVSCNSKFMEKAMVNVAEAIREKFHWVKEHEIIHLVMDNAGGTERRNVGRNMRNYWPKNT